MRVHGRVGLDGPRAGGRDDTKDQICQLLTSPGLGRESSGRNWLTLATRRVVSGGRERKMSLQREETDRDLEF